MKEQGQLPDLTRTLFYTLEKSIKTYRQFAQRNIKAQNLDITIDQWLILKTIKDQPELNQKEIANQVFKDFASVTRIIELLVKRGYLNRALHPEDRRRYWLTLTKDGEKVYKELVPVITQNRKVALEGIGKDEIKQIQILLEKITRNCLTS